MPEAVPKRFRTDQEAIVKKEGKMAKVTLEPWMKRIHGKRGNVVFRRGRKGQITITKVPDMSTVQWSPAQQAHRQRFKQAVAYAKAAMANERVHQVYEKAAAQQGKRPFDLAVSDYFRDKDLLSGK